MSFISAFLRNLIRSVCRSFAASMERVSLSSSSWFQIKPSILCSTSSSSSINSSLERRQRTKLRNRCVLYGSSQIRRHHHSLLLSSHVDRWNDDHNLPTGKTPDRVDVDETRLHRCTWYSSIDFYLRLQISMYHCDKSGFSLFKLVERRSDVESFRKFQ